jgi:hypothetical protein
MPNSVISILCPDEAFGSNMQNESEKKSTKKKEK